MSTLVRWNPFREMMSLRNEVDRLLETTMEWPRFERASLGGLALDLSESEDGYKVRASVPGINPDDLDISISDNVLTIKGEFKADEETREETYHLRERRYGSFARSVTFPVMVNPDGVEATYENGVITLHVPKAEEVKPKRISVNVGNKDKAKVIEGTASK